MSTLVHTGKEAPINCVGTAYASPLHVYEYMHVHNYTYIPVGEPVFGGAYMILHLLGAYTYSTSVPV